MNTPHWELEDILQTKNKTQLKTKIKNTHDQTIKKGLRNPYTKNPPINHDNPGVLKDPPTCSVKCFEGEG